MLNFNQLRCFFYTAKHLSYTKAAGDLFITQPAITAQIKALETNCRLKLFKKKGRNVYLTTEGELLFSYAKKIFLLEGQIEHVIDDMRELRRGMLRLGTTKAYARYFMPLMLSTFHHVYPHIRIELNEGNSLEMAQLLLEFKNEIAIIAKAGDVPGIRFIPFSQEEMTVVTAPDHPLTKQGSVSFTELTEEPFIMKDKGSGTRWLTDRLFSREKCRPNILMEVGNTEFIKQLVERGEGISFLVYETVRAEIAKGTLVAVPLRSETVYLDVSIAYLEGQQLSPPATAFMDTLNKLQFGRKMTPQGIGTFMAKILSQKQ